MKSTRKSLFLAIFSTFLCVVMLAGMTFAWFTDTVASGKNKIVSGNLDVEFEYSKDMSDWKTVKDTTDLFSDVALWEPGAVSLVYFRIANKGSLAIKYNVSIMVDNETAGTNVNGESFKLSDYVLFGTVADVTTKYATREEAIEAVSGSSKKISDGFGFADTMKANDPEKIFALIVYMPETLGNEVNYKTGTTAPSIEIGAALNAAQLSFETDSFDNTYDETAAFTWLGAIDDVPAAVDSVITIETAEQLAGLAKAVNSGTTYEGITVKLASDLDLGNVAWTPIGGNTMASYPGITFGGIFDGQGHTISNLKVASTEPDYACAGLFGAITGTIQNVNLKNVNISSSHYAGAIVAYASTCGKVISCNVDGGLVVSIPELIGTEYDNGDKIGGIAGYGIDVVENCSVKNLTVMGYRDIGGIIGCCDGATITGNTIGENVKLNYVKVAPYVGNTENKNMGDIVGRENGTNEISNNSGTAVKGEANTITTVAELTVFEKLVNGGNKFTGQTIKLGADIDLAGVEWEPIGADTEGFAGIFDGQGHTISNLNSTRAQYNGFFGKLYGGTVKNVIFDNARISVENWGAVIVGYTACGGSEITGCTVKNSVVTGVFNTDGTDNSDNAAAIIGFVQPGGNDITISNNTVENVTVQAYRKSGFIVGFLNGSIGTGFNLESNKVKNSTLIVDNTYNYKNFADTAPATHLMDNIVGGKNGGTVSATNTTENISTKNIP